MQYRILLFDYLNNDYLALFETKFAKLSSTFEPTRMARDFSSYQNSYSKGAIRSRMFATKTITFSLQCSLVTLVRTKKKAGKKIVMLVTIASSYAQETTFSVASSILIAISELPEIST